MAPSPKRQSQRKVVNNVLRNWWAWSALVRGARTHRQKASGMDEHGLAIAILAEGNSPAISIAEKAEKCQNRS